MRLIILYLLTLVFLTHCKNEKKIAPQGTGFSFHTKYGETLPADFLDFYEKFHSDSAYQMEHIVWPMDGEKWVRTDTAGFQTEKMIWTPEEWKLHHLPDLQNGIFEIEFTKMGDNLVLEVIFSRKIELRQERRFAKIANDDWKMIYYSEM